MQSLGRVVRLRQTKNVNPSKKHTRAAAEKIVGVFEAHFAKLPPGERRKREQAFDKALTKFALQCCKTSEAALVLSRGWKKTDQ